MARCAPHSASSSLATQRTYLGHSVNRIASVGYNAELLNQSPARRRFASFHGMPFARLNRHQSICEDNDHHRSSILVLMSALLLFAPEAQMKRLREVVVDGYVDMSTWTALISKLKQEWQDLLLLVRLYIHYSTNINVSVSPVYQAEVLLAVNFSLLAIPSIDTPSMAGPMRSRTQLASYMSIVATTCSLVIGFLLSSRSLIIVKDPKISAKDLSYRRETPTTEAQKRERVWEGRDEERGEKRRRVQIELSLSTPTIALVYSLPYGLLLWGYVINIC